MHILPGKHFLTTKKLRFTKDNRKKLEFYGTDEELKKEEQEKSDMRQIRMGLITAVVMVGIVIGLMLLPFIL